MSEEEKKVIERIDYIQYFIKEIGPYYTDVNDMEYFSTVLNLIEKQQKEIEELKTTKKELTERVLRLESDKFWDNIISKDKIKAKIEEYDKKKKDIPHEIDLKAFYTITDIRNIQIDVLKALLEEE